jgi:4-hydroxy-tetrahydrodipicolinate synthase
MKELKGIMPLIPTPLTDEGNIDENSLKRLIDFELENGCSGVGVLAAIGEGYLVSHDSWKKVIEITVKHMHGKAPVMVGCPSLGTLSAIELCREAEDLGADAILAFNPQGFRSYSTTELISHYMALTEAVKIHVAPYARGEDPIAFEVISALYEKKRISYMKYAWKSCEQLEKMAKDFKDFFIFCGADTFTLRYLLLGCKGVLTATAAMLPREHVDLLAMINKGDIQGAREHYARAITTWNDIGFNNMSTWQAIHKIALREMGIIKSARVTMPQSKPAPHQIDEIMLFVKYYTG